MRFFIWIALIFLLSMKVEAEEKPEELYAQSAVLMDADTGRVLFEKNGSVVKAMASTTKIMTCILALEEQRNHDVVIFSNKASIQPKVHLGASEGEQFYMEDLLYSLMLESHNDAAVAIAETISESTEAFACMMNTKAREIGCTDTYFITPNGLDSEDEYGMHSTTAIDLAKIMSYCINESPCKEQFLEITGTESYEFSNLDSTKKYYCMNRNTYLSMNDEAISGKTGYTAKAGYCYVGAVKSGNRTFVVTLLACGWPNHKNYKWLDMNNMIQYATNTYQKRNLDTNISLEQVLVNKGIRDELFEEKNISVKILATEQSFLLGNDEELDICVQQIKNVEAPIEEGEQLGSVLFALQGEKVAEYPIVSAEAVKRIDFFWIFGKIIKLYLV